MTIKAYSAGTPNGYKVSIFLELLGLKYDLEKIDILKNVQKEDWFLKLNPNGRIPTLVDLSTNTTISETAAILIYLADTYDKDYKFSFKHGTPEYYKSLEIIFFQMAGVGPMQGQANHFTRAAPEKIQYGIDRYTNETRRLYGVVNEYLQRNESNSGFLVGDHLSIADITIFGWAIFLPSLGISYDEFPLVKKWLFRILDIPEVKKGLKVPNKPIRWSDEFPSLDD